MGPPVALAQAEIQSTERWPLYNRISLERRAHSLKEGGLERDGVLAHLDTYDLGPNNPSNFVSLTWHTITWIDGRLT